MVTRAVNWSWRYYTTVLSKHTSISEVLTIQAPSPYILCTYTKDKASHHKYVYNMLWSGNLMIEWCNLRTEHTYIPDTIQSLDVACIPLSIKRPSPYFFVIITIISLHLSTCQKAWTKRDVQYPTIGYFAIYNQGKYFFR